MLSIHWDLLKPKEKVKICSLLYKKSLKTNCENRVKNFIETLDIKHRITGVERISKFLSSESITKKKTKSDYRTEAYMDLFIGVILILLIPIIMHWILDLFNDDRRIPYEWNTVDIILTAVYIFLSLVQILVAIIAFDTAKKFK